MRTRDSNSRGREQQGRSGAAPRSAGGGASGRRSSGTAASQREGGFSRQRKDEREKVAGSGGRPADRAVRARKSPTVTARPVEDVFEPHPDVISGRHPVLEALKSGRTLNKIVIAEGSEGGSLAEIVGKAKAAGIMIQQAPRIQLTKLAGERHQGVIAFGAAHAYAELEDIVSRETGSAPLIVLLDEVTDPHNLGAVLRTAEAVGAQGVVIPKRRAVPLTGVVAKVAAGALEHTPVARVTNLVQTIERLQSLGYWVVGTATEATDLYTTVDYRGKIAVVIGAEGKGLTRLVQEKCDFLVCLPMLGALASLNASVAAGVLLYEVVRQRS